MHTIIYTCINTLTIYYNIYIDTNATLTSAVGTGPSPTWQSNITC